MNQYWVRVSWLALLVSVEITAVGFPAYAQAPDPAAVEIIQALRLHETREPIREDARWARPRKVAVAFRSGLDTTREAFIGDLQSVAGDAEVILFDPSDSDLDQIIDADVLIGFCNPRLLKQLDNLRWIHSYAVGVDRCLSDPDVRKLDFIMTNNQRVSGPSIAEHAIAMMLMLNGNLHRYQQAQYRQRWAQSGIDQTRDVAGRTMLILGLGGIGTETARKASALGLRVIATRNSSREGPDFVDKVGLADEMYVLAGEADFVVNAVPLTAKTGGMIDSRFFAAMKPGAYYITVGRGKTTVTDDLVAALNDGKLGGAGVDVTDPEPLPADHPLWTAKNVVITPHVAAHNSDSVKRTLIIARENLRRYAAGEKLLNLVDVEQGY